MKVWRSFGVAFAALAAATVLAAGCGNDRGQFAQPPPAGTFAPSPPCAATQCSPDLSAVIECDGTPTPCGAGLGCVAGSCIPACEAARTEQSTVGCEYYPVVPSIVNVSAGSCYAVLLANVWNSPAELKLAWGDQKISTSYVRIPRKVGNGFSYDLLPDGKLPPGQLAIAFLSGKKEPFGIALGGTPLGTNCPADVGAAIDDAGLANSGRSKAFHLETSVPIVAYDIFPYGGAASFFPSSSLLLPTSAWDTNYVAVGGYPSGSQILAFGAFPYLQIVAATDNTTVKLLPTVTLNGGPGLPTGPAGVPYSTTMARGEMIQFWQKDEVNGTIVEADQPIAVVGGHQCAYVRDDEPACDTLHQQLPPVRLMGNAYVATRYRDRASDNTTNHEIVPWRIVGVVDGTQLTFDPPVAAAPKTIDRGVVAEFRAPGPFVVTTQDVDHPIHVLAYMTGGTNAVVPMVCSTCYDGFGAMGDPEMVNIVPRDQFLSKYLFLTDPTYGNTNLVFVRSAKDAKDVTLDCLGTVKGWQAIGGSGYEMARVDMMFNGEPVGECENGVHRASSDAPFGLTVWGFDLTASYGYPAGMAAKPLNHVTVPVVR